ncbi:MAG: DUF4235 domain-containing protein [Propionibacteriaceae bacterium]|jgi:hypothetical protein|nr:DUF4235 domain-containing protein [Propionibacteriaceae bacterium]
MSGLSRRIYTTVLGAVVSAIAAHVLRKAWKLVTGAEPPNLKDTDSPPAKALVWLAVSAVGTGAASLAVSRLLRPRPTPTLEP